MLKRLGSVIVLFCLGLTLVATPSPAQADPYQAAIKTRCHVSTPRIIKVNHRVRVRVNVRANGNARPKGRVKIVIRRAGGVFVVVRTVKYRGSPVRLRTRQIHRVGRYRISMRFTSAKSPHFKSCTDSARFKVVRRLVSANETGPGTAPNNTGPNNTGPNNTGPNNTGPNNTGPNNTGPNNTGPNTNVAPASTGPSTPSGVLPDTGGPNVWWLVLGFGLVLGGVGLVAAGRRGRVVHAS